VTYPGIGVYNYSAIVKSAAHELTIRATAITRKANSTSATSTRDTCTLPRFVEHHNPSCQDILQWQCNIGNLKLNMTRLRIKLILEFKESTHFVGQHEGLQVY